MTPINRDYHSTVFYYTVIENDQPRLLQFVCEHGGTRAFLAGSGLVNNGFLRLGRGRFPLLLQVRVGETEPWGRIWTTPRFVAAVEDHAQQAADRYTRDLAEWERGREEWLARGRDLPSIPRLVQMAEQRMRRHATLRGRIARLVQRRRSYSRYAHTVGTLPFEVAWHTAAGQRFGGSRPAAAGTCRCGPPACRTGAASRFIPGTDPAALEQRLFPQRRFRLGLRAGTARPPAGLQMGLRSALGPLGRPDVRDLRAASGGVCPNALSVRRHGEEPEGILPQALRDEDKGFCQFRNRWRDGDDFVACIYGKSEPTGGGWSYADGASFRLFGCETMWAVKGGGNKDGGQDVENVVTIPGTSGWLGARVTHWAPRADGGGSVTFDTSDLYLARPDGKGGSAGDVLQEAPPGTNW